MRTLYLMCGISFSGKTTLARKIIERLQCAYISLDDINAERGLWGGDGIPVEEWERTHALARVRLATWMATGKDAVVDDVNSLRWLRDRWRAAASANCYRTVVIYLDIPQSSLSIQRRSFSLLGPKGLGGTSQRSHGKPKHYSEANWRPVGHRNCKPSCWRSASRFS
jgi:predicted kinase